MRRLRKRGRRKRKKGKKKKRKEKKRSERSFLSCGRSVNRAWKGRAFLANDITCTPFKVGPSDSDLGFDENRGERDDNTVIVSFLSFFPSRLLSISFRGEYC